MGRARHGARREGHRSRSSTQGHPQLRVFSPHSNASPPHPPMPSSPSQRDESDTVTNLPLSHQNTLGEGSLRSNTQPQVSPSNNRSVPELSPFNWLCSYMQPMWAFPCLTIHRSPNQPTSSDQDRAGPSELQSFSESLKSRLNAVSMRYPISIQLPLVCICFCNNPKWFLMNNVDTKNQYQRTRGAGKIDSFHAALPLQILALRLKERSVPESPLCPAWWNV